MTEQQPDTDMQTHQVVISFHIIKDMFHDRGVVTDLLSDVTNDELIEKYKDSHNFILDVNDTMQVLYLLKGSKLKSKDVLEIIDKSKKEYILIVSEEKPNITFYKTVVNSNATSETKVQVFHIRELMFNPFRHELVPKHEILSIEDANQVVKSLNLKSITQLPLIFQDDPIARYLFVKCGQVIKITRNSITSGTYNYYRYCV
jgi:DNA-directed RNA polymerase I, II, and III subunit RPABC1